MGELTISAAECPICDTLEVITWYQPALFHFAGFGETVKATVHICQCGFILTMDTESVHPFPLRMPDYLGPVLHA